MNVLFPFFGNWRLTQIVVLTPVMLLLGCDPVVGLKPIGIQENDSKKESEWAARIIQLGVSVTIEGVVAKYSVGAVIFYVTIVNERPNSIKLRRRNISIGMDDQHRELTPNAVHVRKDNPSEKFEELVIEPIRPTIVSFGFEATGIPRESVVLKIDSFEDVKTGERIPFEVKFLMPR